MSAQVLEVPVTVTGLPTTVKERYVTRAELAQIMGVSVKSVDRLVAAGMPSVTWGLRARRFLPSVALAWAQEQHGWIGKGGEDPQPISTVSPFERLTWEAE